MKKLLFLLPSLLPILFHTVMKLMVSQLEPPLTKCLPNAKGDSRYLSYMFFFFLTPPKYPLKQQLSTYFERWEKAETQGTHTHSPGDQNPNGGKTDPLKPLTQPHVLSYANLTPCRDQDKLGPMRFPAIVCLQRGSERATLEVKREAGLMCKSSCCRGIPLLVALVT